MNVPFLDDYRDRGWHNFDENLTQPRHRWYPFKEGFSNQLVSTAVSQASRGKRRRLVVLDPFAGSGTTPVTAAMMGHDAVALEVNPFCAFTIRAKCWRGTNRRFIMEAAETLSKSSGLELQSPLEGTSTFTERAGNQKWLFNVPVIRAFTATWNSILDQCKTGSVPLKLAAIFAAMRCCNAKKDGKALRYFSDWEKRKHDQETFRRNFLNSVGKMVRDVEIAPIHGQQRVVIHEGDCRRKLEKIESGSCDLLVTSPPYLNSFDYSDVYRPELFLGGFVTTNEELRKIRLKTLRSHVQVNWEGDTAVANSMVETAVKSLQRKRTLWNRKLPLMVEAYFHDMNIVLRHAARILKAGAEAWIVVSTSAYKGVHIQVDLILAELACANSFQLKGVYALRSLRAAGQQQSRFQGTGLPLRESLLVLQR